MRTQIYTLQFPSVFVELAVSLCLLHECSLLLIPAPNKATLHLHHESPTLQSTRLNKVVASGLTPPDHHQAGLLTAPDFSMGCRSWGGTLQVSAAWPAVMSRPSLRGLKCPCGAVAVRAGLECVAHAWDALSWLIQKSSGAPFSVPSKREHQFQSSPGRRGRSFTVDSTGPDLQALHMSMPTLKAFPGACPHHAIWSYHACGVVTSLAACPWVATTTRAALFMLHGPLLFLPMVPPAP